jgi:hypothetical protein
MPDGWRRLSSAANEGVNVGKAIFSGLAVAGVIAVALISAGGSSAEEGPSRPQSENSVVEPTFVPNPSGQTT